MFPSLEESFAIRLAREALACAYSTMPASAVDVLYRDKQGRRRERFSERMAARGGTTGAGDRRLPLRNRPAMRGACMGYPDPGMRAAIQPPLRAAQCGTVAPKTNRSSPSPCDGEGVG